MLMIHCHNTEISGSEGRKEGFIFNNLTDWMLKSSRIFLDVLLEYFLHLDTNPAHKCHDCFAMRPNMPLSGDIQVFCSTSGNPVQTASRGNDTVSIILSRSLKGKLALTSVLNFWEGNFRFPSSGARVESCAWLRPSSREVLSFHNKIANNSLPPTAKEHPTMSLTVSLTVSLAKLLLESMLWETWLPHTLYMEPPSLFVVYCRPGTSNCGRTKSYTFSHLTGSS